MSWTDSSSESARQKLNFSYKNIYQLTDNYNNGIFILKSNITGGNYFPWYNYSSVSRYFWKMAWKFYSNSNLDWPTDGLKMDSKAQHPYLWRNFSNINMVNIFLLFFFFCRKHCIMLEFGMRLPVSAHHRNSGIWITRSYGPITLHSEALIPHDTQHVNRSHANAGKPWEITTVIILYAGWLEWTASKGCPEVEQTCRSRLSIIIEVRLV